MMNRHLSNEALREGLEEAFVAHLMQSDIGMEGLLRIALDDGELTEALVRSVMKVCDGIDYRSPAMHREFKEVLESIARDEYHAQRPSTPVPVPPAMAMVGGVAR